MKTGDIVIAPEGCGEYLTEGKEYVVEFIIGQQTKSGVLFRVTADNGEEVWTNEKESSHLNMKDWILKPKES